MKLKTERLYAREFMPDDLDIVRMIDTDEEIMKYIRPASKTEEEVQITFNKLIASSADDERFGFRMLIETISEERLGWIVLRKYKTDDVYEFGYLLKKDAWGKGYATEICVKIIQYAFTECKIEKLVAITHPDNLSSQHVLLKCGLVFEKNVVDDLGDGLLFSIYNL